MKNVSILKTHWKKGSNGIWGINDLKSLKLKSKKEFELDFFKIESEIELLTQMPRGNFNDIVATFGTTEFLLKQSITPIVAWVDGSDHVRCIGTAFMISCTGYMITASHVIRDPEDEEYAPPKQESDGTLTFPNHLHIGVMIPVNPASQLKVSNMILEVEKCWYWGGEKKSPLLNEKGRFEYGTDIAIFKIPEHPLKVAYQPLNLSLNQFIVGERAFAIGYAEMANIPVEYKDGKMSFGNFNHELFVSVGHVMNNYPNYPIKEVPTPGPCFDFSAKIPGKMSGSPIFGGDGAVVRGIVSSSYSGEKHAYGSMLGPTMNLPFAGSNDLSLKKLMLSGNEGMSKVIGAGL